MSTETLRKYVLATILSPLKRQEALDDSPAFILILAPWSKPPWFRLPDQPRATCVTEQVILSSISTPVKWRFQRPPLHMFKRHFIIVTRRAQNS